MKANRKLDGTSTDAPVLHLRARSKAVAKPDVHTEITNAIIEHLQNGVRPWTIPWGEGDGKGNVVTRPLRHNGVPFSGANVLRLWMAAEEFGYRSPFWFTFSQARKIGGHVRKGQKSVSVIRMGEKIWKELDPETQEEKEVVRYVARSYSVFNAEQIDGLSADFLKPAAKPKGVERIEAADKFIQATGANIVHSGDEAWYDLKNDSIQLPVRERFFDAEGYYSTICHELTHWTRHKDRLDRSFGHQRFGDAGYAMEELVAELGSAFLAADLGITPAVREDHAAYIGEWLKVLKDDDRAIFNAANHAQCAVDYLSSFSRPQIQDEEEHEAPRTTTRRPRIPKQIEFDFYGGPRPRHVEPHPTAIQPPVMGDNRLQGFGRQLPSDIFAKPYAERFPPPSPIGKGTRLELIDQEDPDQDDYGEVLLVTGQMAEVVWKKSGEHILIPTEELWDFVVEDWTHEHWETTEPG